MPAKKTQSIHCVFHPKDGVSELEVGSLSRWVGALKGVSRHAIVLEENKKEGKHCHIALAFNYILTQETVRDDFMKTFEKSFLTDTRWNTKCGNMMPAIKIGHHPDLECLVGGYFSKQEMPTVISMVGFDKEKLSEGKVKYEGKVEAKKKHVCVKDNFTGLMIEKHSKHWNSNETYQNMTDEEQVDYCFRQILLDGYKNYVHIYTKPLRGTLIKFWHSIVN